MLIKTTNQSNQNMVNETQKIVNKTTYKVYICRLTHTHTHTHTWGTTKIGPVRKKLQDTLQQD